MNFHAPDPLARQWLKLSGALVLGIAVLVLAGRLTGIPGLITFVPTGVPMALATALGFVGLGIALLAHGTSRHTVGMVAAGSLIALGLGTLALYALADLFGWQRFTYDPANIVLQRGMGGHGRMSPNTATSFALTGAAILLLQMRRLQPLWTGLLLAVLLAMSLLAVLSYVVGLRSAAAWWRNAAMAAPTAAAFLAATLALVLWLVRRAAAAEGIVTRTLPYFIVAGTATLVLCTVVLVSNDQRQSAARLENHALQVDAAIDRFIASVARLESATRAYALTGDAPYLTRIDVHRASITAAVNDLVELTADSASQQARAQALRPLVAQKFAVNEEQVLARKERGAEAAAEVLRAEAPELMAGLRAVTESLQTEGQQDLVGRRAQTALNELRLRWILASGALVAVGLIAGAFSLVRAAQRDLERANEQLEARVRQRTAELEASAERLGESERSLRFLADTMPQLVWTARADGIIESLNQGWWEFLGVKSEADALRGYARALHPDDLGATMREWERMLRERRPAGGEARLRRGDGLYRWHLWRAHPERDMAGDIVRWVGTWTDIHDKKLAEEQLEQRVAARTAELATSEERFRQAFDFAGIGMAIVGLDGRWLRVNPSLCEIVGYSEAELLGKTFQDITHPDDLAADLALVADLVAGKRRFFQMEKRYFHREGHVVWVRLTVSIVRDDTQRPVHFISQIEDITATKGLEDRLAKARDQALEASRLKSEFLAMMSHEIRTPMNGVIGMTSLLRDTELSPVQEEYVRTIESSGESLLSIINDVLDYSKIEAGRIELEVAPFDLRQCVEDALDLFAGKAQEKGIELRHTFTPGTPAGVVGDSTRLRQVLVNLLSNALKFTEAGSIHVGIESEVVAGRHRLHVAVRDTGIGIPAEGMGRLFKSFSQVDASTTRRFGGTGLGLAISKRLAEVMGGTMWAESRPGEGSTFHFTAVVDAHEQAMAGEATDEPRYDETLGNRCPLRLLVAEDNAVNQRVALLLLKRIGYRATIVANGLEAVAATNVADYDAILMDVEMPEVDGCEATRRIRAQGGSPTRPWIIALTASAMDGDRERALRAGMNDFVTKPVRTETLSEALLRAHAALSRSQLAGASANAAQAAQKPAAS